VNVDAAGIGYYLAKHLQDLGYPPWRVGAARRLEWRDYSAIDQALTLRPELNKTKDVRALPVVERGVVVGILTKTDLDPFRGRKEWSTVQLAMEAPLMVAPEARVAEVARVLLDRGFGAVPVAVDDVAIGMVARQDLLRVLTGAAGR
jgi:predicted transcriptional regulator